MKIKWAGRARRLAISDADGSRHVIFVHPGDTIDVPDGARLAGEGTNWTKAKEPAKSKSTEEK